MPQLTRITRDPAVMGGKPCIRGMRITVRRVLEILATYADRQVTVDILYELVGPRLKRGFDIAAHTINLMFMALFGFAMTFKVYDILRAGEISAELRIPVWTGYTLASLGILAAVATAAIRWWLVVVRRQ